jgi:hypothetical protein
MKAQFDDLFIINQMRDNPKCLIHGDSLNDWYKNADLLNEDDVAGAYLYFAGQQHLYKNIFDKTNCTNAPMGIFMRFLYDKVEQCRYIANLSQKGVPDSRKFGYCITPGKIYFLNEAELNYLANFTFLQLQYPEIHSEEAVLRRAQMQVWWWLNKPFRQQLNRLIKKFSYG